MSKVVLMDFFAEWCGPCKMQDPINEEIKKKFGDKIEIKKVDVDTNFELASKFTIHAVPTLILEKDGAVFKRYTGVTSAKVLEADINAALGIKVVDVKVRGTDVKGDYSLVRDRNENVLGFWIKNPEDMLSDSQDNNVAMRHLKLRMLATKLSLSKEIYTMIMNGNYRIVPNTFDDAGGVFIMFGTELAPGEKH